MHWVGLIITQTCRKHTFLFCHVLEQPQDPFNTIQLRLLLGVWVAMQLGDQEVVLLPCRVASEPALSERCSATQAEGITHACVNSVRWPLGTKHVGPSGQGGGTAQTTHSAACIMTHHARQLQAWCICCCSSSCYTGHGWHHDSPTPAAHLPRQFLGESCWSVKWHVCKHAKECKVSHQQDRRRPQMRSSEHPATPRGLAEASLPRKGISTRRRHHPRTPANDVLLSLLHHIRKLACSCRKSCSLTRMMQEWALIKSTHNCVCPVKASAQQLHMQEHVTPLVSDQAQQLQK